MHILTHHHTLTDKLLLFFTHGAIPPVDSDGTFSEPTSVILSTIRQRNMETGNSVVISVYREREVFGDPFKSGFYNQLSPVHKHVSCAKEF